MLRLLFNAEGAPEAIEFHNSVPFGIVHGIGKYSRALSLAGSFAQVLSQVVTVKNIVAQHKSTSGVAYKTLAHQKSLRDPFRLGLHLVLQLDSKLTTVPQQGLELENIVRCGNKKDFAYACQHKSAERVVNHGLVVDRQQAFPHGMGYRIQARSRSTGQNNSSVHRTVRGVHHEFINVGPN